MACAPIYPSHHAWILISCAWIPSPWESFFTLFWLWHPLLGCFSHLYSLFTLLMLHFLHTSALLTLLWLLCPLLPQHTQMPTLLCSFWCLSTKLLYWREEKRRKQRPNVFYGNNVNQVYVWQKQIFPWCGSRYLENLEGAFGNLLKLHEWLGLLV